MKNSLLFLGSLLLAVACSHNVQKAELPATADPAQEILKLDKDIQSAQKTHTDVLAPEDYKGAQKMLSEARQGLLDNEKQADILDDLAVGRGYLNRATGTATQRRPAVEGILKTREKAMEAGATNHPVHSRTLGEIDNDLRKQTNDPSAIPAKDVGEFQARYLDLELAALKSAQLDPALARIQAARDQDAKKHAPRSLRQAEVDYTSAENAISSNRNEPSEFKAAVDKANESAQNLTEVLAEIQKTNVSEDTAFGIVQGRRKIAGLQTQLSTSKDEANKRERELRQQGRSLQEARLSVEFQQAIDTARQQFAEDEAEVFQQGGKLIIRLKKMNFPINRSELPPASLALLAKTKNVAEDLNPKEIVVEGHTDSTGGSALNEKLSKARAEAVANYLETSGLNTKVEAVGYGFEKPLASNKTAAGRAQNRRVDVIVTPSGGDESDLSLTE